jgi:hypothetical protein
MTELVDAETQMMLDMTIEDYMELTDCQCEALCECDD